MVRRGPMRSARTPAGPEPSAEAAKNPATAPPRPAASNPRSPCSWTPSAPVRKPGSAPAAAGVLATAAGALPGFLTGALGVQLQGDLGFDAAGLGGAVAGFFAASALGSGPAGVLAERIGPRRTIYVGTIATAVVLIGVAVTVRTWVHLVIALVLAGAFNALIQPAVNALLINDAAEGRRGLAFGIKQSGVPAATLVGGMAVPLLALTVGWRAAYLAGAGVAILAACAVPRSASGGVAPKHEAEHEQQQEPRRSRAVLSPWLLLLA